MTKTNRQAVQASANLQVRLTKEDWADVPTSNRLAKDMATAERKIEQVLTGKAPFLLLTGLHGIGKSQAIDAAIARSGRMPLRPAVSREEDIIEAFRTAGSKTPIIFEELTSVFSSVNMLDMLKVAFNTGARHYDRREMVEYEVEDDEGGIKIKKRMELVRHYFSAPTIITTNADLVDLRDFPASARKHITALVDRAGASHLHIQAEPETVWEYAGYLAVCHGLIATVERANSKGKTTTIHIPASIQDEALAWFTVNLFRFSQPSLRTLIAVAKVMELGRDNRQHWEEDLRSLLTDPYAPDFEPEGVPRIFERKTAMAPKSMGSVAAKPRLRTVISNPPKIETDPTEGLTRTLGSGAKAEFSDGKGYACADSAKPWASMIFWADLDDRDDPHWWPSREEAKAWVEKTIHMLIGPEPKPPYEIVKAV